MSTKKRLLEIVQKIADVKKNEKKAFDQISAYEFTQDLHAFTKELTKVYAELDRKQKTPITKDLLEKNGFYWGLTSDEQDQEALMNMSFEKGYVYDDAEIMVKFQEIGDELCGIMYARNKDGYYSSIMANLNTIADLEDALDLCGIDKEIEL